MRGITRDTLVELVDRKILFVFLAIVLFALLLSFATKSMEFKIQMQTPDGSGPMVNPLANAALKVFDGFLSVLIFVAVMVSAGLIPRILEKGTVEYYLTKPLSRSSLFVQKLWAILVVYGGTVLVCGAIVYLISGATHSMLDSGAIYMFMGAIVQLIIWFTLTASVGVMTGSMPMAIVAAFLAWVLQSILRTHEMIGSLVKSPIWKHAIDGLYYLLPKTSEISDYSFNLATGQEIESWMPFWSSLLFSAVLLYVTILVFRRKEF